VADGAPALPIELTAAFALAVALAGLLGRGRMPAGVGGGLFLAAVSGAAIVLLALDPAANLSRPALGHVLTGLAVLWYAASRLASRGAGRGASRAALPASSRATAPLWAHAALACGLVAIASLASVPGGLTRGTWSAGATDFTVLVALAALIRVFRTGAWAPYPTVALLVCLLVLLAPADGWGARASAWGLGLNVVAVLCLAVVIGMILLDWWRTRRRWLEQQYRFQGTPPWPDSLLASLVTVCAFVGLGGLFLRGAWFTPTALWLAGLTCVVIGHLRGWLLAGEIGLALAGAGIVSAAMAWLTPGWPGALLGLGLAGGYLLWLARFWDQQLLDGVAWTTAGRLIPGARRLGYMASSGAGAATAAGLLAGAFDGQALWSSALSVGVLLGVMSLLVRDALAHGRADALATACLVAVAAIGPGCGLTVGLADVPLVPAVGVAGALLLVAIRVGLAVAAGRGSTGRLRGSTVGVEPRGCDSAGTEPGRYASAGAGTGDYGAAVYGAVVGGVLPVVMLFALSWSGFTGQTVIGVVLTLAAVVVGAVVLSSDARVADAGE
jgi:hypothetical protein